MMIRIVNVVMAILLISGVSLKSQIISLSAEDDIPSQKVERALLEIDSWRYGEISVYKYENMQNVANIVKDYVGGEDAKIADSTTLKTFMAKYQEQPFMYDGEAIQDIFKEIENGADEGKYPDEVVDNIANNLGLSVDEEDVELVLPFWAPNEAGRDLETAYVITKRPKNEKEKGEIIALIVSETDENPYVDISDVNAANYVFSFIEMKVIDSKNSNKPNEKLFDLVENDLNQDLLMPVTDEVQKLGENIFEPEYGTLTPLFVSETHIEEGDIQNMIRISNGQANDLLDNKNNELIIGPDLISWLQYPDAAYVTDPTNAKLPKYGAELRYGIEDLNFPSFWSERVTLNAMWDNAKLGLILPTRGWSTAMNDVMGLDDKRVFTTAGPGIAAQFDFPFPVVKSSGVFRFSMSYVSGDAEKSPFKVEKGDLDETHDYNYDFLVRAHAQLHYTFGVRIDDNYLFRFGIGGTVYNVEKWHQKVTVDYTQYPPKSEKKYKFYSDETYGGLSGRIDFMTNSKKRTPWGLTAQYFDETVGLNGWIQFPVIENTLAIKIGVNSFISLRDDDPDLYPWELDNKAVFIPMIRFVYMF